MKRFALFSFGVLCLMLAVAVGFHIGSQTAQAQGPGLVVAYSVDGVMSQQYVMMDNGDVYARSIIYGWDPTDTYQVPLYTSERPVHYVGNFWNGAPVPIENSTWGGVKGLYDQKGD